MLIQDALNLANSLMRRHGLTQKGWKLELNKRHGSLGLCSYARSTIYLSKYFILENPEIEIENTTKHEICHALVGPYVKAHGYEWQLKCIELGCRPSRVNHTAKITKTGRYEAVCPGCGRKFVKKWMKYSIQVSNSRHPYCQKCGPVRGKITWVDTLYPTVPTTSVNTPAKVAANVVMNNSPIFAKINLEQVSTAV